MTQITVCRSYFWDRYSKIWIVINLDASGDQVGGAQYAANKANLNHMLKVTSPRVPTARILADESCQTFVKRVTK